MKNANIVKELALDMVPMDEDCLHRIARGRVVALGVAHNFQRHPLVTVSVHIHMAHALGMAQHRDALADLLHFSDHFAGTPWDDQVDEFCKIVYFWLFYKQIFAYLLSNSLIK
jgi:hypothetical protein